ncbi:extracellular metalloproteinase MEP [Ceratobasidium sp. AG-Ba]|nr:extracellular metalloproteinase MEP [Ceratobasidium sp. AG-Ba]
MDAYVGSQRGIWDYLYSTSMVTDPLSYSPPRSRIRVHDAGEGWAEICREIYELLILGFSSKNNYSDGIAGKLVNLHLLVDGLQLQPYNPTVVAARDAMIQPNVNRYNSSNKCLLWGAFA